MIALHHKSSRWACESFRIGRICYIKHETRRVRWYTSETVSPRRTEIGKIIHDSIKVAGPMSVSTYMQMCLSHPTYGYYQNPSHQVLGSQGDFTTSPEISQVFGELIALWHITQWDRLGRPPKIRIVELGPGRGTLMHDMLQVFARFRDIAAALRSIHLVENSASMQKVQEDNLQQLTTDNGWILRWYDAIDEIAKDHVSESLDDVHTIVVANEFFDALPIHILEKFNSEWHELLIAISTNETSVEEFQFVRSSQPSITSRLLGTSSPRFANIPDSGRLEVSAVSFKLARKLAELANSGISGSGLIIDYGGDYPSGNSLRAFKNHKIADIFEQPGECDLTANVDFAYLKESMNGIVETHGPLTQSTFLKKMGVQLRVNMLMKNAISKERRDQIESSAQRLIDTTGMGRQYQVMGITCHRKKDISLHDSNVWPFSH